MSATVEKTFTISFADSDGGDHGPNIPDGPNIPNNPDVPHGPNDPSYPPDPDDPTQPESPTEDDPTPYLEIELDEELNEGKTSFAPGGVAYINVWRNPLSSYNIQSAAGKLTPDGKGIPQKYSDIVTFKNTDEGQISQTPQAGSMSSSWKGNNPGVMPVFEGRTVTVNKTVVAVLQCDYNGIKDRWKLSGVDEEMTVPVVATMGGLDSDIEISFEEQEDAEDGETEDVGLKTIHCETGDPVSGVSVWIDNTYQGATNAQGIIGIGLRTVGDIVIARWSKGEHSGEKEITI
jgi:hypothetical protein